MYTGGRGLTAQIGQTSSFETLRVLATRLAVLARGRESPKQSTLDDLQESGRLRKLLRRSSIRTPAAMKRNPPLKARTGAVPLTSLQ